MLGFVLPLQRFPWASTASTLVFYGTVLVVLQKMRIFEMEYPQMKYHANLFSISMQKILF